MGNTLKKDASGQLCLVASTVAGVTSGGVVPDLTNKGSPFYFLFFPPSPLKVRQV